MSSASAIPVLVDGVKNGRPLMQSMCAGETIPTNFERIISRIWFKPSGDSGEMSVSRLRRGCTLKTVGQSSCSARNDVLRGLAISVHDATPRGFDNFSAVSACLAFKPYKGCLASLALCDDESCSEMIDFGVLSPLLDLIRGGNRLLEVRR